jgi:hypothetical protein
VRFRKERGWVNCRKEMGDDGEWVVVVVFVYSYCMHSN